jgi:hypothetical protein
MNDSTPKSWTATSESDRVTLGDCPIGLFQSEDGELCVRTQYAHSNGRIEAYIVSSGEFFWGRQPQTAANQRMQMVLPVTVTEYDYDASKDAPTPSETEQ